MNRPPDLTTNVPMNIWVVNTTELPPDCETFAFTRIPGVRLVFGPVKEDDDGESKPEPPIQ